MGCECNKATTYGRSSYQNQTLNRPTPESSTGEHCSNHFLPPFNGENYIQIKDCKGIVRHKIYNNTLAASYVSGNVVNLKVSSENKILLLTFDSNKEAVVALIKFQEYYREYREFNNI